MHMVSSRAIPGHDGSRTAAVGGAGFLAAKSERPSLAGPHRELVWKLTSVYESANRQPGLSASLCIYSGTRCTKIVQMQPASGSARPKKSRNSGAWPDPEKKARYTCNRATI
eukprot:6192321-Pleurochrysis_carterae.AAC.2